MAIAKTRNNNKLNLFLDILLVIIFVIVSESHITDLRTHKLLGLLFTIILVLHIVLHWAWIVSVTKSFFNLLLHGSRLNYMLDVVLFINMVVALGTGFAISRTLGLDFDIPRSAIRGWTTLHATSSRLTLITVALHIALHWKWIAAHAKKYLFAFKPSRRPLPAIEPDATAAD
jgi:hypothetical protein